MRLKSLIEALTDVLNQECVLLTAVDGEIYTRSGTGAFRSCIGSHIRHNLDHFTSFFEGLETGEIDYEKRRRDEGIARSVEHALADVEKQIKALGRLSARQDRPMRVREEREYDTDEELSWLDSSLGRELQFLLGHTVHHHAIIALLLSQHGADLPEGFGIAPSTQRHEKGKAGGTARDCRFS